MINENVHSKGAYESLSSSCSEAVCEVFAMVAVAAASNERRNFFLGTKGDSQVSKHTPVREWAKVAKVVSRSDSRPRG